MSQRTFIFNFSQYINHIEEQKRLEIKHKFLIFLDIITQKKLEIKFTYLKREHEPKDTVNGQKLVKNKFVNIN